MVSIKISEFPGRPPFFLPCNERLSGIRGVPAEIKTKIGETKVEDQTGTKP